MPPGSVCGTARPLYWCHQGIISGTTHTILYARFPHRSILCIQHKFCCGTSVVRVEPNRLVCMILRMWAVPEMTTPTAPPGSAGIAIKFSYLCSWSYTPCLSCIHDALLSSSWSMIHAVLVISIALCGCHFHVLVVRECMWSVVCEWTPDVHGPCLYVL